MLDSLTKSIGIGTAIMVAISINYEHWYYKYFGISLTQVPASFQDHIKSSLNFLPIIMGAVIGSHASKILFRRFPSLEPFVDNDKIKQAINANKPFPMPLTLKVIGLTSVLFIIVDIIRWHNLPLFNRLSILEMSLYFVCYCIMWWLFAHPVFTSNTRKLIFTAYTATFVIFVFVPSAAYNRASTDVTFGNKYFITTTDNKQKKQQVTILRSYEKYLFVGYTSASVTMLPQANILMIEKAFTPSK